MEEAMIEMAKQLPAAFILIIQAHLFLKDRSKESANNRAAAEQRRAIAEKQEAARLESADKQETARLEFAEKQETTRLEAEAVRHERFADIANKHNEVMGAVLEQLRQD